MLFGNQQSNYIISSYFFGVPTCCSRLCFLFFALFKTNLLLEVLQWAAISKKPFSKICIFGYRWVESRSEWMMMIIIIISSRHSWKWLAVITDFDSLNTFASIKAFLRVESIKQNHRVYEIVSRTILVEVRCLRGISKWLGLRKFNLMIQCFKTPECWAFKGALKGSNELLIMPLMISLHVFT